MFLALTGVLGARALLALWYWALRDRPFFSLYPHERFLLRPRTLLLLGISILCILGGVYYPEPDTVEIVGNGVVDNAAQGTVRSITQTLTLSLAILLVGMLLVAHFYLLYLVVCQRPKPSSKDLIDPDLDGPSTFVPNTDSSTMGPTWDDRGHPRCPNCNKEVRVRRGYCRHCGHSFVPAWVPLLRIACFFLAGMDFGDGDSDN